jgi:GTP pyrophosphokinase
MSQLLTKELTEKQLKQKQRLISQGETSPLLERALELAFSVGDTGSHFPHGVDVAQNLRDLGADEVALIAALLSDPRLGNRLSEAEIQTFFGVEITRLIERVHWLNTFSACEQEKAQTAQQAESLRRMLLAVVKDVRALLVKLAYRVEQLRSLQKHTYEIRRCLARETLDIYAPLANRLGIAQLKWKLEDLAFRYLDPQVYKSLALALEESRAARESYIERFIFNLNSALQQEGIFAEVYGRPKHIYSIWRKMQQKDCKFEELYDLRAVRVTVSKVADCYAVLGAVHALWHPIPQQFDDYIANPKENGYQSLHSAVIGPENKIVEIQIRTREMHELAERGVAAHWSYKEGGVQDAVLQRSIASLRGLLEADYNDAELLNDFTHEPFHDRVFVLTPSGEIKDLPRGVTPLDFAYAIHTEVGHRCRGAKVNGRIVTLSTELKTGDQVEILTAKEGRPSRDWANPQLGYLATSSARAKVRHWFKLLDRDKHIQEGRAIVERELRRLGMAGTDLETIPVQFNLHSVEDLLAAVGRGEINPGQIAAVLQVPELSVSKLPTVDKRRAPKRAIEASEIRIRGVGNLLTQIANCCKPMPGVDIIGYITRGKGVTIHCRDCPNVLNLAEEQSERLIEVEWGRETALYPVDVHVEAYDRQGLLRDIAGVLSKEKVNLLRANTHADQTNQIVIMKLLLEIENTTQLSRLLAKLSQVPNIVEIRRITA